MQIHETLDRDPRKSALANDGQARITDLRDARERAELRAELETFVGDGQYGLAIERILQSYLQHLDRPRQNAVWVSGFFGSGKSHLLKVFGHLWADTDLGDGETARSAVRGLSDEIRAQFRELDVQATRAGCTPIAACGTLPSGTSDTVRLTVLAIVLRSRGLPEQYFQARFCFWLREQALLDKVRTEVEAAGKVWLKELNSLYASGVIAGALLKHDPNFASDELQARQVLREQFPNRPSDISTTDFLETARMALAPEGGQLPLTTLVLDEVQQYIGDSNARATTITELAEAIQTQMDSRVLLVASGQSALSAQTPQLQKLKDRFRINVQLSDTDVEAVIRKVLLHKKPSGVAPIEKVLSANAGEVSKQLQGTSICEQSGDRDTIVVDYPLLPTRRRFWEECYRVVDAAGTHSQLRSQLRIIHDALQKIAERPLGCTITADALFESLAPEMVNTGVLLNELNNRIESLADGNDEGRLRQRLCGLVFLINKLPREEGVDIGVRATARMLADLLVDDLNANSGPFRQSVEQQLEALSTDGTLMQVGDEYRLQTTEGAEWDRALRSKMKALRDSEGEILEKRDQLFTATVQSALREIRLTHGQAKIRRSLDLHVGTDDLGDVGDGITVWLRDGWAASQKDVEDAARRAGSEDAVIHVFLPQKAPNELRSKIIETEAARLILGTKGVPSSPEGKEARDAMNSRHAAATAKLNEMVDDIVRSAKVYKGGGSEEFGVSLPAKIESAATASLARLFPRFDEADHSANAWEAARKRAQEGSDSPFRTIQHAGPTEEHPVAREALRVIGAGKSGSEIRRELQAAPYGWPRDAIDAALVALHRDGAVRVTLNGQPMSPAQLDQNKIPKAEFRAEKVRLSTVQKLAIRGLYQKVHLPGKPGEEEATAPAFLTAVVRLAEDAGGNAPLPPRPDTSRLDEIRRSSGTDQLGDILAAREEIEGWIAEWTAAAEIAAKRRPGWDALNSLLAQAEGLPIAAEIKPEVQAIRDNRSLLDSTDYVAPLLKKLEDALRAALKRAHAACEAVHEREASGLDVSEAWQALSREQREPIAKRNRLDPIPALDVSSLERLTAAIRERPLASWTELAESLPTRFANARAEAARELEPKTQTVTLRSDTLRDEAAVRAWLGETEAALLLKLADGPIQIG